MTDQENIDELAGLKSQIAAMQAAEAEWRKTEIRLHAAEQLNRRILETVPGGITHVDPDGFIRYANPKAAQLLGVDLSEITRQTVLDFKLKTIWEDGSPCLVDDYPVTKCLRSGEPQPGETIGVRHASGDVAWLIISALPLVEPGLNEMRGALVTFLDITKRKRAEEALKQSEDRYRRLVEQAPDAIIVHREGRFVLVNNAAVKLYGAKGPEDLIGRKVMELVHPASRAAVAARIRQVSEHKLPTPVSPQNVLRLDGTIAPVETNGTPVILDGQPCIQVIVRDVSERQQAQEALRASEEKWRSLATNAPSFIGTLDRDGKILFLNHPVFGQPPEELVGRSAYDVVDPQFHAAMRGAIDEMFRTGNQASFDTHQVEGDKITAWFTSRVGPIRHHGAIVGAMIISTDITGQKQAEAALLRAKADLELRVAERTEELVRKNQELEAEISERARAEAELRDKQRFLQQTLDMHERERKLVAYEIHDTFVQDVIGALMFIDAYHNKNFQPESSGWEDFERARQLLRKSIGEARRMIGNLRPPIIDEQGIVAAIDYLVSDVRSRGREVDFVHQMPSARLPAMLEATIFRIAQEALTNFERHSRTDYAQVSLARTDGGVRLEIRDFGIGFNPQKKSHGHFGLQGIQERARLAGGSVDVASSPGKGVRISVELPVSPLAEKFEAVES